MSYLYTLCEDKNGVKYTNRIIDNFPSKKFQSQVFSVENAFCEHYGHKPEFLGFPFCVFKTSTRKGQNGHFLGQPKMSKKWGYNYPSSILAIGRFKRKKIFEFQTKYFRLKSHNSEYFSSSGRGEFIIQSLFAISRVASHPFHTPPPHHRHPSPPGVL